MEHAGSAADPASHEGEHNVYLKLASLIAILVVAMAVFIKMRVHIAIVIGCGAILLGGVFAWLIARSLTHRLVERERELSVANDRLRSAAEFLHEIYKTMPGALIVLDRDGKIDAVNDEGAALLEYRQDELVGRSMLDIFALEQVPDLAALAAEGGAALRAEKNCRTRNGKQVPVFLSANSLHDRKTGGVVCVAVDLRDRKRLEHELQQSQKLESVGRLAAGVAHEINTPVQFVNDSVYFVREAMGDLTALLAKHQAVSRAVLEDRPAVAAAAAEEALAAEDTADLAFLLENVPLALDRSLDGLKRVTTIVRSMKAFAHPDQEEMTAVDLNEAIRATVTLACNEYKYVADLVTDLGELRLVVCHVGEINQVVLNIVVNAAHAIGDLVGDSGRRGKITVRTRDLGDAVEIAIADDGGGIPDAIRDRVFDPFFTTKEIGKGTGQGLALARSVIRDKHRGDLTFESEVGRGTTFRIRLPMRDQAIAA